MTRTLARQLAPSLLLLLALLVGGEAAAVPWDQEKVHALAVTLDESVAALLADPGVDPKQDTAMQQRRHEAAIGNTRILHDMSRQLARMLGEGRDRGATQPVFDRIQQLMETIGDLTAENWIRESARPKATSARRAYEALLIFYRS
jgi:hypothetical protein